MNSRKEDDCIGHLNLILFVCFKIASSPAIVELIENWDLEQTESLLEKLEVEKERRREDERKRKEAEASK